jgi:GntR family transcriptional regulator
MVTLRIPVGRGPGDLGRGVAGMDSTDSATMALPLHERVAAAVRRAIASGELGPGDALPTARELADAFGAHPNTVLRAYRALRDEGTIDLRAGRGANVRRAEDGGAAGSPAGHVALRPQLDALVLDATRYGVSIEDLQALVHERHAALADRDAAQRNLRTQRRGT